LAGEVERTFAGVDRRYTGAVFTMIDKHPAGMDGGLKDETGFWVSATTQSRALYLSRKKDYSGGS